MDRDERAALKQLLASERVRATRLGAQLQARGQVQIAGDQGEQTFRARTAELTLDTGSCRVLPLLETDRQLLEDIRRRNLLVPLDPIAAQSLAQYSADVEAVAHDLKAEIGLLRLFASSSARQKAAGAAEWLRERATRLDEMGLETWPPLAVPEPRQPPPALHAILEPGFGFADQAYPERSMIAGPHLGSFGTASARVNSAAVTLDRLRQAAIDAGHRVRQAESHRRVQDIPLDRLRDVTRDRLQLGPLERVGWTTVGDVLRFGDQLTQIDGVGELSARRISGAAHALLNTTFEEMPVLIDIKNRTVETTGLLSALRRYGWYRSEFRTLDEDRALVEELRPLAEVLPREPAELAVATASGSDPQALETKIERLAGNAIRYQQWREPTGDLWEHFASHAAEYFTWLAELGLAKDDAEKARGDLPQDIVDAVRAQELKTDYLRVSLRGYQAFAARFVLVQRKVIIGDEMGLGKTVEALAVLAHLRSMGKAHFLVLCPASVITNWMREISSKTDLAAHRLHGNDREWAGREWLRRGGVAVTTYESLGWYLPKYGNMALDGLIADEAHAIKNPSAKRSQRTAQLLESAWLALLMTGTPLENRVDEFRQLVSYVRPDLAAQTEDLAPGGFRRAVAPAYLRRNQEDVLTELPARIDVEEWVPLSEADQTAYWSAVQAGNFMAMRQAAMQSGEQSSKMERLLSIVEEAEGNGRKVIVYSYFHSVLDLVKTHIPGRVMGPLTGAVRAEQRQAIVDEFSNAVGGAVLVAQIQVGGVGLNIQAASVVVICEPQLKPSLEDQAIARAHRMGQVQSVQVHRLLTDEGVDERIVELLAEKRRIFSAFARQSETAASAPEAFDLSEAELARQVVAQERERLAGVAQASSPEPARGLPLVGPS